MNNEINSIRIMKKRQTLENILTSKRIYDRKYYQKNKQKYIEYSLKPEVHSRKKEYIRKYMQKYRHRSD